MVLEGVVEEGLIFLGLGVVGDVLELLCGEAPGEVDPVQTLPMLL